MASSRPRHIRDIAHIYLSRLDRSGANGTRALTITVAGTTRECIPAFHAVNFALAIARSGTTVELADVSGEPLCAGFFLSLPPSVWVGREGDAASVTAVADLTLRHNIGDGPAGGAVRVVLLPPLSDARRHRETAAQVAERADAVPARVYFAAGEGPDEETLSGGDAWVVDVEGPTRPSPSGGARFPGRIVRWRAALVDPVPPVLRDPGSALARGYLNIAQTIVQVSPDGGRGRPHDTSGTTRRVVRAQRRHRGGALRAR